MEKTLFFFTKIKGQLKIPEDLNAVVLNSILYTIFCQNFTAYTEDIEEKLFLHQSRTVSLLKIHEM